MVRVDERTVHWARHTAASRLAGQSAMVTLVAPFAAAFVLVLVGMRMPGAQVSEQDQSVILRNRAPFVAAALGLLIGAML